MTDDNLEVGDFFVVPSEQPGGKTYKVVRFSTFKGNYMDGYLVITYEEPDGCAWTMGMYGFRRQGYAKVPEEEAGWA